MGEPPKPQCEGVHDHCNAGSARRARRRSRRILNVRFYLNSANDQNSQSRRYGSCVDGAVHRIIRGHRCRRDRLSPSCRLYGHEAWYQSPKYWRPALPIRQTITTHQKTPSIPNPIIVPRDRWKACRQVSPSLWMSLVSLAPRTS